MRKSNSKGLNENAASQQPGSTSTVVSDKEVSYHDYLQVANSSANNISYIQHHNNSSFEVEDNRHQHHIHLQHHSIVGNIGGSSLSHTPLSPGLRSSSYIPQAFLQKQFDENTFESDCKANIQNRQVSSRYGWANGIMPHSFIEIAGSQLPVISSHNDGHRHNHTSFWDNSQNPHSSFDNMNASSAAAAGVVAPTISVGCSDTDTMHPYNSNLLADAPSVFYRRVRGSSQNQKLFQQQIYMMDEEDGSEREGVDGNYQQEEGSSGFPRYSHSHPSNAMNYDGYRKEPQGYHNHRITNNNNHSHQLAMHRRKDSFNAKEFSMSSPLGKIASTQYSHYHHDPNARRHLFGEENDFKYSPMKTTQQGQMTPLGKARFDVSGDEEGRDNNESNMNDEGSRNNEHQLKQASTRRVVSSNELQPLPQGFAFGSNMSAVMAAAAAVVAAAATASAQCICNCKKTRCLKLYCECFAKLGYCGEGCHCHQCSNRPEYEEERQLAISEAKQRNPDAFQPKISCEVQGDSQALDDASNLSHSSQRKPLVESLKKGCNCRRTKCLKKYCECFNAGAYCSQLCKCENCENHKHNPYLNNPNRRTAAASNGNNISPMAVSTSNSSFIGTTGYFPSTTTIPSIGAPLTHASAVSMLQFHAREMSHQSIGGSENYQDIELSSVYQQIDGSRSTAEENNQENVQGEQAKAFSTQKGADFSFAKSKLNSAAQSHHPLIKGKLLFGNDGENEDSSSQASQSDLSSGSNINQSKALQLKTLKKKGISRKHKSKKIVRVILDDSDEESNHNVEKQTKNFQCKDNAEDDEALLAKQLEEIEKKLRQIEQIQSMLMYQQRLKEEQQQQQQVQTVTTAFTHQIQSDEDDDLEEEVEEEYDENSNGETNTNKYAEKSECLDLNLAFQQEKQKLQQTMQEEEQFDRLKQEYIQIKVTNDPLTPHKEGASISEQQSQSIEKRKAKKKKRTEFSAEKNHLSTHALEQENALPDINTVTSSNPLFSLGNISSVKLSENLFDPETFHTQPYAVHQQSLNFPPYPHPRNKRITQSP